MCDFRRGDEDLHAFDFVHPDEGSFFDGLAGSAPGGPDHGAQFHLALGGHVVHRRGDIALGADDGVHVGFGELATVAPSTIKNTTMAMSQKMDAGFMGFYLLADWFVTIEYQKQRENAIDAIPKNSNLALEI